MTVFPKIWCYTRRDSKSWNHHDENIWARGMILEEAVDLSSDRLLMNEFYDNATKKVEDFRSKICFRNSYMFRVYDRNMYVLIVVKKDFCAFQQHYEW